MSVGFNTSKEVSNVASMQNTNEVQQGSFKEHKVSIGKDSVVEAFNLTNSISFPNKTLAERKVSVAH